MASQISSLTIVCSTVYSDADQRKHQSSAALVNFPHKGPVTREMFPCDDVIKVLRCDVIFPVVKQGPILPIYLRVTSPVPEQSSPVPAKQPRKTWLNKSYEINNSYYSHKKTQENNSVCIFQGAYHICLNTKPLPSRKTNNTDFPRCLH